jgi:hypothetical protein
VRERIRGRIQSTERVAAQASIVPRKRERRRAVVMRGSQAEGVGRLRGWQWQLDSGSGGS